MSEPMNVTIEVWPVAADDAGIWLVSGQDAWRPRLPVMADSEPHAEVELELAQHGAQRSTALIHSTSWRVGGPRVVLTYIAVLRPKGTVRDEWPQALPISPDMADALGKPPTNAATNVPAQRYAGVLLHAVRHLRFLLDNDATAAATLDSAWQQHLPHFEPALAGLYGMSIEEAGGGGLPTSESMNVTVEVWPVAADDAGIWLVSGQDAWRPRLPVMADSEPHAEVELELAQHGAPWSTLFIHSTSWRVDGPRIVLTYMAVVRPEDNVRQEWPDALPVSVNMTRVVGKPPTNAATDPPAPRYIDVLLHGIRHLRFLLEDDAIAAATLDSKWRRHLEDFKPTLAGMYSDEHQAPAA